MNIMTNRTGLIGQERDNGIRVSCRNFFQMLVPCLRLVLEKKLPANGL